MEQALTRRDLLGAGAAAATGICAASGLGGLRAGLEAALATPARHGRLGDIEHIVIFVQENRSFDHYFGTFPGVIGFGDPRARRAHDGSDLPVFAQPGYEVAGYDGHLYPFHLDTRMNGECTHDITHDWGPQHRVWNRGRMNGWIREHLAAEGPDFGTLTMGYYERSDLEYYFALAEAFTICDRFHCSVIGPTDPNQLYLVSGTIDPAGREGGPVLETFEADRAAHFGSLRWRTMPEQLEAKGISWKGYSSDNISPFEDSPLPLFERFQNDPALRARGLQQTFPGDFLDDVRSGYLPQVSWIWELITNSEHPPAPVAWGQNSTDMIVRELVAQPELWSKTALFITWDENGGFFDHVPPPVAARNTPGEYLSVDPLPDVAQGIRGPIGLGFRVPMLVVSPFSRGGLVCSDVFDHTSLLRFIQRRFGVEVPHLSRWRRRTTGDLTSAFNFAGRPRTAAPRLPRTSLLDPRVIASTCPVTALSLTGLEVPPYPVPPNSMPAQERGRPRRPSGL